MQVLLAQPRGFCAGVNRAIAIVAKALAVYGSPIYVRHEIVHNKTVVNELKEKGAIFVDHLTEVPDPNKVGYVTQTTLSTDETKEVIARLKARFPSIRSLSAADICYATQSRQEAVKKLAAMVDLVLVIGSSTSSNSRRLRDKAQREGVRAFLIDSVADIEPSWFDGVEKVGLTAGASAPEHLVQGVVEYLKANGVTSVETMPGVPDRIAFPLPAGL